MQTAAGVWTDWRYKTHLLCWARHSGVVGRQRASWISFSVAAFINSDLVDFCFLVWSLSRVMCCVSSGSNVAAA